ncbi:IclR family transcriptional regulator [Jannaschia sp. CCS1]|uniref:IclR family transcriptional regulator n=1 Tax=Jannaschia sp. (strain CCS1) TaxID=290400 RepID=UPI000053B7CA|nr:IclR family transcriptional regulator [Jannaschia sp. CCS1]ABD56712.1 transcriptional regulator, IclR family [Jannaschia sp. CCS1]
MSAGSGERLLSILDLFTETRLAWSPAEMMDALGYSRPTLYRYLKLLKETGFLAPLPGGRFGLGPRVVELDFLVRASDPLVARSQSHLDALAERFPGTAFVVQWYGTKMLCVASASQDKSARTSYPRGRPMPLTTGAAAKVILAHLPKRRQDVILAGHADAEDVRARLRDVRREGVAVAHGEVTDGIVGTAAPILDAGGHPLGSLCVSMGAAQYAELTQSILEDAVRTKAAEISETAIRAEANQMEQA